MAFYVYDEWVMMVMVHFLPLRLLLLGKQSSVAVWMSASHPTSDSSPAPGQWRHFRRSVCDDVLDLLSVCATINGAPRDMPPGTTDWYHGPNCAGLSLSF